MRQQVTELLARQVAVHERMRGAWNRGDIYALRALEAESAEIAQAIATLGSKTDAQEVAAALLRASRARDLRGAQKRLYEALLSLGILLQELTGLHEAQEVIALGELALDVGELQGILNIQPRKGTA